MKITDSKIIEGSLMPDGSYELGMTDVKYAPMIKPNELRVGNWISQEGFHQRVVAIMQNDVIVEAYPQNWQLKYEVFDPIELTPEILEKAGFEKGEDYWEHSTSDVCLGIPNLNLMTSLGEYTVSFTQIKYLHQLQNLYFALTNSELEINL